MDFKRLFAIFVIVALTFPFLFNWVSAHPGHTDGNGGHTDSGSGDYHYHHGYEAHAHFDIDGNGTIDCPYDFDDQTGTRSGPSSGSGSYTPGDGSEDGYQEGYADGHKKGSLEGRKTGYEDGYADAERKYTKMAEKVATQHSLELSELKATFTKVLAALVVSLLVSILLLCFSVKKRASVKADCAQRIDLIKRQHAADTRNLEDAHQRQINKLKNSCEDRITKVSSDYSRLTAKLHAEHAAEMKKLHLRLTNFRRLEVLERIAKSMDDSIKLPEGVALRPSYTPIRGKTSKRYPYGTYTIFMTATGKTYHCLCDCVPNARPSHFFDRPTDATPCRKCVPLDTYPQDLPDWYTRLREKIESIVPNEPTPTAPPQLPPAADDQIRFSLDDSRIQFSLKES